MTVPSPQRTQEWKIRAEEDRNYLVTIQSDESHSKVYAICCWDHREGGQMKQRTMAGNGKNTIKNF